MNDPKKTTVPELYVDYEGGIRNAENGEIVATVSDIGHISEEDRISYAEFIVDAVNKERARIMSSGGDAP